MFESMTSSEIVRGVAPADIEAFAGAAVDGAWAVRRCGKIVAACWRIAMDDGREWVWLDTGKNAPDFATGRMAKLYMDWRKARGATELFTTRDAGLPTSKRFLEWLGFSFFETAEDDEVWVWRL